MGKIEIYDCTLREGEQAVGASFSQQRRLRLFQMLDEFKIDFIELGWPISSQETLDSFKECKEIQKHSKIVAFGSTSKENNPSKDKNIKSIIDSRADYACIFGKSWLEHVKFQLKITPEENLNRIKASIEFLKNQGIHVFYDAEHFFDAYKAHPGYAISTLQSALVSGAERIILCDTNGGTLPWTAKKIVKETKNNLSDLGHKANLGVHFHNDCGLALANTLSSLPYIVQVQGTINGLGERVGNLNLSEFLPVYIKKMGNSLPVDLKKLKNLNEEAFHLSGTIMPENRPFVGDTSFAHKGGVHIDATNKGASYEHADPSDFGNKRVIVLNTLGGKSSILHAAANAGFNLNSKDPDTLEKINSLYKELKEQENQGYRIGNLPAEHYLLIQKHFGAAKDFFIINKWSIHTSKEKILENSHFLVTGTINSRYFDKEKSIEGGPVQAVYQTMAELLGEAYPSIKNLGLKDFHVSIATPSGEKSTVRTLIKFSANDQSFETVGVDKNIIASAVEAVIKGMRYYLMTQLK